MTYPVESYSVTKTAEFGFYFRSYPLFFHRGVTFNVICTNSLTTNISAGNRCLGAADNTTRVLWVLDSAGIYPGIVSSDRKVLDTGKLRELAAINANFGCVMKVPTRQQTLVSLFLERGTDVVVVVVLCQARRIHANQGWTASGRRFENFYDDQIADTRPSRNNNN